MRPAQIALTGAAAAALHGLEGFRDCDWPERWATPENGTRKPGVIRTRAWSEPVVIDGKRVTQVPLTLAMLGEEVTSIPRWNGDSKFLVPSDLCELAVEHAIRDGLATDSSLRTLAVGGHRATLLRGVLAHRPADIAACESYYETRSIQLLRDLGYTNIWRQVWVYGDGTNGFRRYRVDLVIPVRSRNVRFGPQQPEVLKPWHGLLFELDGKVWHDNPQSFQRDHARDLDYKLWGYSHLAVTPTQVDYHQRLVAEAIKQGLRQVDRLS